MVKLSKRDILAGAAAAAIPTFAGANSLPASAAGTDPIFALIERHRAAEAERSRLLDLVNAAYDRVPDSIQATLWRVHIGLFVTPGGYLSSHASSHNEIDHGFENAIKRPNNETPDEFRTRRAEAHAALDRNREMLERALREAGCREAEAALEAADKVVEAVEEPLAAATATTVAGLFALVRYADEVADEEVGQRLSVDESMALYLLPAIERSLVRLMA